MFDIRYFLVTLLVAYTTIYEIPTNTEKQAATSSCVDVLASQNIIIHCHSSPRQEDQASCLMQMIATWMDILVNVVVVHRLYVSHGYQPI